MVFFLNDMKKINLKIIISINIAVVTLMLSMQNSFASNCKDNGDYTRVYANISSPLLIRPELNVGDVISTTTTSFPSGNSPVACTIPGPGTITAMGYGTANGNLYPTSISGVSYKIKITSAWAVPGLSNSYWPVSSVYSDSKLTNGYYSGGTIQIDLVKTGPTPGTATWAPNILGQIKSQVNGLQYNFIEIYNSTPVVTVPQNPACKVTQSAIPVSLEDVNTAQLSQVGNTSKDTAFTIPLSCTATANISLGFSGNMADNNNAVFSNLSGSTNSSQVGIQILSGSTPVPINIGSYLNLGQVNGTFSVPLVARYYALASNPKAGAVSAIAYATLIYN